jgi:Translation initiation factor 2 (IF-2; GTPase)
MPVEVLGLDEVPQAGDRFEVVADNQALKFLVEKRKQMEIGSHNYHVTLESLHDLLVKGEVKELNVIIKADMQGTAEAIADSVRLCPTKTCRQEYCAPHLVTFQKMTLILLPLPMP